MAQTKLVCKFYHHDVSKMTSMVSNDCLWDTKPSNNMIENENRRCSTICLKRRHRLGPFSKIINRKDDIRMLMSPNFGTIRAHFGLLYLLKPFIFICLCMHFLVISCCL